MNGLSLMCAALLVWPAQTDSATTAPENRSILRAASGEYVYRTIKEQTPRGWERFQLLVHPDQSRTLLMWHNLAARNAQFSVVLRVDEAFRPLETFLSYWVADGFKGTTLVRVADDKVTVDSRGPAGETRESMVAPSRFSVGTHPVSGDGWHVPDEPLADGQSTTLKLLSMEAGNDTAKLPTGTWMDMPIERIGGATIETPAGRFDTTHYRLGGFSDVWLHGPDRVLIKMQAAQRDLEYVLVRFEVDAG